MPTAEKEIVTSQEAMRILGISRPKLYQLIAEGRLHAPEKGLFDSRRGRLTFDKEEVERVLAERKEELDRLRREAQAKQGE